MKKITLFSIVFALICCVSLTACHSFGAEISEQESEALWTQLEGYWLEKYMLRFSSFEEAQDFANNANFEEVEHGYISWYYMSEGKRTYKSLTYNYANVLSPDILEFASIKFHEKNGGVCQVMELLPDAYTVEVLESITPDYYIYSVHSSDPEAANYYPYYGVRKRVESPDIMYDAIIEKISPILDKSLLALTKKVEYNVSDDLMRQEIMYNDNQPTIEIIKNTVTKWNITCVEFNFGLGGNFSVADGFTKDGAERYIEGKLGYYHYGVTDSLYLTFMSKNIDYSKCLIEMVTPNEVVLDCEMRSDSTIRTKLYFSVVE